MSELAELAELPVGIIALLVVLVVVQIALQIVALINVAKLPPERVRGGRKWPWVLAIIFLSNMALGVILYFAVGRLPLPVADATPTRPLDDNVVARTVDVLYGDKDDVR